MRLLAAVGRFWLDFVVGDDWRIAAAVASVLVVGALVAATASGRGSWLAPAAGTALAAAFALAFLLGVRRGGA